jgi:hypothetical protein
MNKNREMFAYIVKRVIKQYFLKPNYLKFEGMPLFSISSIDNLIEGFGRVEATCEALDYFREEVKKAGFPDLHIQWNQVDGERLSATRYAERF